MTATFEIPGPVLECDPRAVPDEAGRRGGRFESSGRQKIRRPNVWIANC
jgi:hypothetical protein